MVWYFDKVSAANNSLAAAYFLPEARKIKLLKVACRWQRWLNPGKAWESQNLPPSHVGALTRTCLAKCCH